MTTGFWGPEKKPKNVFDSIMSLICFTLRNTDKNHTILSGKQPQASDMSLLFLHHSHDNIFWPAHGKLYDK